MTTYVASTSAAAQTGTLAVIAGSFEARISALSVFCCVSGTAGDLWLSTVSTWSGGWSGGTTASVTPFRAGAPAATASAKSGGSGAGTGRTFAANCNNPPFAYNFTWQPTFDLIIAPGTAVAIDLNAPIANGTTLTCGFQIYFEELRLSWHS